MSEDVSSSPPLSASADSPPEPVSPVSPQWPPAWLGAPAPLPEAPRRDLPRLGWRLPNGTVVCRSCSAAPPRAGAEPVRLADAPEPRWEADPTVPRDAETQPPEPSTAAVADAPISEGF